jgi:hypothetical protein
VAGVYVSTYTTSGPFAFNLRQYEPVTMTLQGSVADRAYAVVVDGRVWCLGTGTDAGYIYELDRDDITTQLQSVNVSSAGYLSSANGRLYLSEASGSTSNDRVDRLDPTDGSVIWTVSGTICGPNPTHVSDDGTYVYVVNADGTARTVTKLDLSDGSFVDDVQLSGEPTQVVVIGGTVFAARANAFDAIDTATMTVSSSYSASGLGYGIATDGVDLFLSRTGVGNSFGSRFDVASSTIAETVTLLDSQAGIGCAFDQRLYTTGAGVGGVQSVVEYDIGPITELTSASVSGYPFLVSALYRNPGAGWVVGSVGW